MLSKNKIKQINSLELKKNRDKEGLFVAEGDKLVSELLAVFHCETLVATRRWLDKAGLERFSHTIEEIVETETVDEIKKISQLSTPSEVLGVFRKTQHIFSSERCFSGEALVLALDAVQDPGNLGTIIRIADWFGISDVVCSKDTADVFNPKTVQSTMGAIARVRVHYTDLLPFIDECLAHGLPVYGTFLDGDNIYSERLTRGGVVVMGNEGKGVSPTVEAAVTHKLSIPCFPAGAATSESLNVAVATAIVCSEFRRRL